MVNIVMKCWVSIPDHFVHVELDEFIVMPNHIHGIIALTIVGAIHCALMLIAPYIAINQTTIERINQGG